MSMALAKVACESGIMNGHRRFGRSMENGFDLNGEEHLSPPSEPALLLPSQQDSLMDMSCCLDVLLKLLDASGRNLSTLNHQSPVLTEFISCFIATHTGLLRDNSSPLLESDRFFIALMAAETHRCHSLVCIYANEYLLHGGDVKWLHNFRSTTTVIPRKFSQLGEINEILAHTPWLINKEHISKLAAGVQGERWSISELIQAVIILAHVHSLASLLAGFRMVPGQSTSRSPSHNDSNQTQNTPKLSIGSRRNDTACNKRVPNRSGVELLEHFLSDPSMSCADFCQRRNKQQAGNNVPLSPHYFSWEVQGYSLANITNVQFGDLIDAELKSVKKLFDTFAGHTVIATGRCSGANLMENVSAEVSDSKKCYALWQYVHCLLGICYDDYKYSQLDVMLSANLRSYVKLVACCPERLAEDGYHDLAQSINDCEKMSVHAIVSEARLQVELMFCLNAILLHQTESKVNR